MASSLESLPRLRLQKGRMKRAAHGHPWVFSNELVEVPPLEPGTIVQMDGPAGEPLGTGYYNPRTLISFRWLVRGAPLEEEWLEKRIEAAVAKRASIYPGEDCVRLVFGEADDLPGLVVDKYGDCLAVQVNTAGMERLRQRAEAALTSLIKPRQLVRKDDGPQREMEGLRRGVEAAVASQESSAQVSYLGLKINVDLSGGQKTGLFLDQRENVRALIGRMTRGTSILDVFCYRGAWGMAALKAGASRAEFVDASLEACEAVEAALAGNGLPEFDIHQGDSFDILPRLHGAKKRFGAVVTDPPAFAKSKKHLPEALKAYSRLNEMAMRLVEPGGLLAACSCSHHVGIEEFLQALRESAAKAKRKATLIELRGQAPDHPVLLNFPEGAYLKCVLLAIE